MPGELVPGSALSGEGPSGVSECAKHLGLYLAPPAGTWGGFLPSLHLSVLICKVGMGLYLPLGVRIQGELPR